MLLEWELLGPMSVVQWTTWKHWRRIKWHIKKHTILLQQFSIKTRTDVGADSRHNMLPSVQLPSVSGVDSKLGLTMVRTSLQSAPEPTALDPQPRSKHDARLLWRFLMSSDHDLWPFQLKIGTPLTCAPGKLIVLRFLILSSSPNRTDGQRDGRTDGQARCIMQPIGRPHNNKLEKVALDGSVECCEPPPRWCDLELWPFDPKT